jgi:hypothetical protein
MIFISAYYSWVLDAARNSGELIVDTFDTQASSDSPLGSTR